MFIPNKKIAFRTHISMGVGLGHYSRLENLESNLKNKAIWFISGERETIKKIYKKKFFYVDGNLKEEIKIIKYLLKNNIKNLIMDLGFKKNISSGKIYKIQNIYLKSGIKLISFDDVRQRIISNISIIPSVSSSRLISVKSNRSKVFFFYLYNFFPKFYKKKTYNNKFKKKIKNILIAISGTDSKAVGFKILRLIANKNYKFTIVSGKKINLNLEKNKIIKKNISRINILNFVSKKNMLNQINKSDLGICGLGIVKFDFSTLQKPFILILEKNDLKNIQIKEFLKFKNCKVIIVNNNFFNSHDNSQILEYIKNFQEQKKNILNSSKYFNKKKLIKKQKNLLKEIIN